jgi:hypothetical protein
MDHYKILIPIWGEEHLKRCCKYLLSSLLAPNNLPYLASSGACEICFLTTEESTTYIKKSTFLQVLNNEIKISYCYIDDLLADGKSYGATLTLAYERGVMSSSAEMQLNTSFIFLNADFVLSDNTCKTIVEKMQSGYSGVISPSLRAIEEEICPLLNEEENKASDMPNYSSRKLVSLALDHLHPTVLGSDINNPTHNLVAHQFFYRADDNILLARFFLMFMLCLKPERPMEEVSSFCDYSLVPLLCPSKNYFVITDSDDIFMLELSRRDQDHEHIKLGKGHFGSLIKRLNYWVTHEQYLFSKNTLIFHKKELPTTEFVKVEKAKICLNEFMKKIYSQIDKCKRASHINHPFWVSCLFYLHQKKLLLNRESKPPVFFAFRYKIKFRLKLLRDLVFARAPMLFNGNHFIFKYIQSLCKNIPKHNVALFIDIRNTNFQKIITACKSIPNVMIIPIDEFNKINLKQFYLSLFYIGAHEIKTTINLINSGNVSSIKKGVLFLDFSDSGHSSIYEKEHIDILFQRNKLMFSDAVMHNGYTLRKRQKNNIMSLLNCLQTMKFNLRSISKCIAAVSLLLISTFATLVANLSLAFRKNTHSIGDNTAYVALFFGNKNKNEENKKCVKKKITRNCKDEAMA